LRSSKSVELEFHLSPEAKGQRRDCVHLWLLDLDEPRAASDHPLLTSDEQERVGRLKDPTVRRRISRRFVLTRQILANMMGAPQEGIKFVPGICGKPRAVAPSSGLGEANFNLSHSENILAVAAGFDVEVGVDVEVIERQTGADTFYQKWTRQEAIAKLVGVGLASDNLQFPNRPSSVSSQKLVFAGKEVVLAVAVARNRDLPDPHQGALPEDPLLLGVPGIDAFRHRDVGQV
jgi:phosphopantetheinyl transferase